MLKGTTGTTRTRDPGRCRTGGLAWAIGLARSGRAVIVREWHNRVGGRLHGDFEGLEIWSQVGFPACCTQHSRGHRYASLWQRELCLSCADVVNRFIFNSIDARNGRLALARLQGRHTSLLLRRLYQPSLLSRVPILWLDSPIADRCATAAVTT